MDFEEQKWDIVIGAKQNPFAIRFRQILEYRDLIILFVKRDIANTYRQTILGPLWYLAQPVCATIMCMIVFQNVAMLGTDGIPPVLFYFAGTVLWALFSSLVTAESKVFRDYKDIFGKVYFPRLTVPIAVLLGELLKFLIQFALFVLVWGRYAAAGHGEYLSPALLLLPFVILWIAILASGVGLIISAVTTKYRDLAKALAYFLSLFMYVTPVVYPLSEVPERHRMFFELNPLTAILESFRMLCFGTGSVSARAVLCSLGCSFLLLLAGIVLFNRNEREFVDVI